MAVVMGRAQLATLLSLCLFACGEPMAGPGYLGEPLASFRGGVAEEGQQGLIHRDDLVAAVFWDAAGLESEGTELLYEQANTGSSVRLNQDYTLRLFDPPADDVFVDGVDYTIGRVLVYPDEDGDGVRGEDELFLGATVGAGLVFAREDLAADASPTGRALEAGYHLLILPLGCGEAPVGHDEDCDVSLGDPCETDADCGADGICLREEAFLGGPWPGGACVAPERRHHDVCRPVGAGFVPRVVPVSAGADQPPAPGEWPIVAYWVAGCSGDDECRVDEGYVCDVGAGACVPKTPLRIAITTTPQLSPFCPGGEVGSGQIDAPPTPPKK